MGICTCKKGKGCSVHFFRRHTNPDKYEEALKTFETKSKKGSRIPEFEIKEEKTLVDNSCDCSNCDCTNHKDCDCEDCECIVCDC